ncbi:MAG: TldD/PmbA family protein [Hyphomicrobiales bacterium]
MIDELVNLAAAAVAEARKRGADAADALAIDRRGTDIELREGQIEKLEQAEARELGLRVFAGHSSAMISGSVLTRDAIVKLAETAVAMARLAPPDPYSGLAEVALLAREAPDLDLVSSTLPDADRLKQMALAAEAAALGVEGVAKSGGAGASAADRTMALATSLGFARGYRRTGVSVSVSAIAGEGTAMERDYDFSSAVHFADLNSPEEVGASAGRRAARRLSSRKVKSQAVPVMFENRIAGSLLGHLAGAINGAAIARGTSFLKDRMGQKIFASGVAVSDDPLRRRGLGSRPFDGEGLAVHARDLIADGVLTGWLLDLHSARQLGLRSQGNGARGLSSPPGPTSSNLYLKPGTETPSTLLRQMGRGLYVTELIGMGVNTVTGDYSRGASGYWVEDGEPAFPVSEITIAGNLKDMFLSLKPANDLEFRGTVNAPGCLVEGLTIAGL